MQNNNLCAVPIRALAASEGLLVLLVWSGRCWSIHSVKFLFRLFCQLPGGLGFGGVTGEILTYGTTLVGVKVRVKRHVKLSKLCIEFSAFLGDSTESIELSQVLLNKVVHGRCDQLTKDRWVFFGWSCFELTIRIEATKYFAVLGMGASACSRKLGYPPRELWEVDMHESRRFSVISATRALVDLGSVRVGQINHAFGLIDEP